MVRVRTSEMSEKDLEGGMGYPEPGTYHCVIDSVKMGDDDEKVIMKFAVLAGDKEGQVGKAFTEYFHIYGSTDEKTLTMQKRLARLAVVTNLLSADKLGNDDEDIDFIAAEGQQLICRVEKNEYTDKNGEKKSSVRLGFMSFWHMSDPDAPQCPRDPVMAGGSVGSGSQQPVASGASNVAANDFSDI